MKISDNPAQGHNNDIQLLFDAVRTGITGDVRALWPRLEIGMDDVALFQHLVNKSALNQPEMLKTILELSAGTPDVWKRIDHRSIMETAVLHNIETLRVLVHPDHWNGSYMQEHSKRAVDMIIYHFKDNSLEQLKVLEAVVDIDHIRYAMRAAIDVTLNTIYSKDDIKMAHKIIDYLIEQYGVAAFDRVEEGLEVYEDNGFECSYFGQIRRSFQEHQMIEQAIPMPASSGRVLKI